MADQQVEVRLRFSQAGLPDLGRAAANAATAFKGLSKEQDAIDARQKSLYSGDTLRVAREMLRVQAERARLTRAEARQGQMAQREFRTSGWLLSDLRDQAQVHRQGMLEHFERRAVEHQVRGERVRSGAYGQLAESAAADRNRDRKVKEQEQRLDRRADLETKYGKRIGGGLHRFEEFARHPATKFASGAAVGVAGGIFGAAMSGFSGTVEMNRLTTEMQLLSREIAGALKPAIDGLTDVLRFVRKMLQKLTPGQQNLLMYGTLGVMGAKGASMLSRRALGMGLVEAGSAAASLVTGRRAAQAAKAAEAARGLSTAETAVLGTGAVSAAAGAKRAGVLGRLGGLARGAGRFGGLALFNPVTASAMGTAGMFKSTYDAFTGGYYSHARETTPTHRGRSKIVAGGVAFGASLWDNIAASVNHVLPTGHELPRYDKRFGIGEAGKSDAQKKKDAQKAAAAHRTVTPADAGFEGIGAGFDRLTVATSMRDYQNDKKNPAEKSADTLDEIWKWIQKQFGVEEAPRVKNKES